MRFKCLLENVPEWKKYLSALPNWESLCDALGKRNRQVKQVFSTARNIEDKNNIHLTAALCICTLGKTKLIALRFL